MPSARVRTLNWILVAVGSRGAFHTESNYIASPSPELVNSAKVKSTFTLEIPKFLGSLVQDTPHPPHPSLLINMLFQPLVAV